MAKDDLNKQNTYEAPGLFTRIYQLLMRFPILQNIRILFYFIDSVLLLFAGRPRKKSSEGAKNTLHRKKLLIVVSFALGDCVLFMEAMKGFRKLYPSDEWEITVTCQKACTSMFKSLADNVIGLEYTKASVDIGVRFKNYCEIRKERYDLIIDPISSSDCSPNVFMTRAACVNRDGKKIGVLEKEPRPYQCPGWMRKKIYDEIIHIDEMDLHRIRLYEKVLRKLGLSDYNGHPAELESVGLPEETKKLLDSCENGYFIVFPSASLQVKKWPIDRCSEIVDRIYRATGYQLVLIGTEHDRPDAKLMIDALKEKVEIIDCIGKTNVAQLPELIGGARLVVTNDTSVYHISVAKQVKTFLLCGGYVFKRFAAYNYEGYNNPVLVYKWRECYDCNNNCKYQVDDTYPCVKDVTVDMVWSEISSYLDNNN